VPTNADPRRPTPNRLNAAIRDAMPLLLRRRVIDAVLAAQRLALGPVTSAQARAAQPVLGHARAFTEVASAVARLGPDELGRRLCPAGTDRKGFARWWVEGRG